MELEYMYLGQCVQVGIDPRGFETDNEGLVGIVTDIDDTPGVFLTVCVTFKNGAQDWGSEHDLLVHPSGGNPVELFKAARRVEDAVNSMNALMAH
ncbi:hypothetical protein QE320_gp155 [Pseudomonas phage EM]|uniref:Uncharacterized protein n=1 Tax=Pseudomonas phage EM TaxID=2936914 RepID=A0AAE9KT03_9CAUD|nr:hypothetical protein QE320_gp155 [Pseudomonas phage EM]UPW35899.1 hypothetical protein EM_114 [Pseudomonas phage EM]